MRRVAISPGRADLLDFVRAHAPDLRIRTKRLEDGKRACWAGFTFRGEWLEGEAIESPEVPDPDDTIVRRCAWLIQRRLGIPTVLEDARRGELERTILDAALRGDTATADAMGRELALANEGMGPSARVRVSFEDFGGFTR